MDPAIERRGEWRVAAGPLGDCYDGRFRVSEWRRPNAFKGHLRACGQQIQVYVLRPPRGGAYEHESCFQLLGDGWFALHFVRPARSFDAAVVFVEDFLELCLASGATPEQEG